MLSGPALFFGLSFYILSRIIVSVMFAKTKVSCVYCYRHSLKFFLLLGMWAAISGLIEAKKLKPFVIAKLSDKILPLMIK